MKSPAIGLVVLVGWALTGCSNDDRGEGTGGGTGGAPPCAESAAGAPGSVVWIQTGEVEHEKDYHSFEGALNADVPTDWTCPVNYADGSYTLQVEVVSLSNSAAQPIYYTVGWKRPKETPRSDDAEYIRTAVKIDEGARAYLKEGKLKELQRVIAGKDAGPIGEDWDWTNAWRPPNGDAFDLGPENAYPLTVRVTMTLHPAP